MPIGSFSFLSPLAHLVLLTNPKAVLDLGIGRGMNGALIRNYFPDTCIHGVEIFEPECKALWHAYDKIFVEDIRSFTQNKLMRGAYQMMIMTDVIEHFTEEDGVIIIKALQAALPTKGALIITTPAVFIEQGEVFGNIYETHRSLWTCEMFEKLGFHMLHRGDADAYQHRMLMAEFIKR